MRLSEAVSAAPRIEIVVSGARGAHSTVPGPAGDVAKAANRVELAAIVGAASGAVRYLTEAGRRGIFEFDSTDNSANVTDDPEQGIYVSPASDPTGASGVWVRRLDTHIDPKWFGANSAAAPNVNRPAIQNAMRKALLLGLTFVWTAIFPIAPAAAGQSILSLTDATGFKMTGATAKMGPKIANDAGNYAAILDFPGTSVEDVLLYDFTIDENAANNTTATPTPGDATKALAAVKCYATGQRRVVCRGVHFKNTPGVNTVLLNSPDNEDAEVNNCRFTFRKTGVVADYDNSAIYIHGRRFNVIGNKFKTLSAAGAARSAIEVHGNGFAVIGNLSTGYRAGVNFCSSPVVPILPIRAVVQGNQFDDVEGGINLWPITGTSVSNFDISGNSIHVNSPLYPASVNVAGGVTLVTTAGVIGEVSDGLIHHNTITHAAMVGDGAHPANQSAGIYMQASIAGGTLFNVQISDNIIKDAPNIGINVFQQTGTAYRVRVMRNHIYDAGNNTGNIYRYAILWRGTVVDAECVGNRIYDSSTTAVPKGSNGVNTNFLLAGSSIVEDDNQIFMSGTGRLACRSSQYATAQRSKAMVWGAAPIIDTLGGVRLFTLNATSVIAATVFPDNVPLPSCPPNTAIRIRITNSSGGTPTINWNAAFVFKNGPLSVPANGATIEIAFSTPDGGTTWIEQWRSAPPNPRIQSVAGAATVTPTFENDQVVITALAAPCQLLNWTGGAINGKLLIVRIKDDGTARALTYDTKYRSMGPALPAATVANKTMYLYFVYNAADDRYDLTLVAQQP